MVTDNYVKKIINSDTDISFETKFSVVQKYMFERKSLTLSLVKQKDDKYVVIIAGLKPMKNTDIVDKYFKEAIKHFKEKDDGKRTKSNKKINK